ncbi:hypothetical protein ACFVS2_20840 [Brevibacillus sp. NPDC058079]|uniref:hypothetical protein n=1 Tax=Brevibacillus sp. NPDC058079 TaxID=3346330 RepID=UPI0036F0C8A5
MGMVKFHPKHPPYLTMGMQALCLLIMIWIGLQYTNDMAFTIFLGVIALFIGSEILGDLIHYRSPKPTVLVFDKGIVAHYQLIVWERIELVSINDEEMTAKIQLKSKNVIQIRLSSLKETPGQFREAVKSFSPHVVL